MTAITKDEFQLWREHPITEWVFAALKAASEAQKQAWIDSSWASGVADPRVLIELNTRADAYRALYETEYERWAELNGEEPVEG